MLSAGSVKGENFVFHFVQLYVSHSTALHRHNVFDLTVKIYFFHNFIDNRTSRWRILFRDRGPCLITMNSILYLLFSGANTPRLNAGRCSERA